MSMVPSLLVLLLPACAPEAEPLGCGPGTHEEDALCVPDEADTATDTDPGGDTASDTDSGTDTDSGGDDADDDGDGWTPAAGDCDDDDGAVHPDAEEVCGNGVDDDCDGAPGACGWAGDHALPDDGYVLAGRRTGDATGYSSAVGGDIDGDGNADLLVGAVAYDDGGEGTGAAYLVRGPVTGDMNLRDAEATLLGSADATRAALDVAFLGDVDADGYGDLIITAEGGQETSGYGRYQPHVYILHGPLSGDVRLEDAGATWAHEVEWDGAGRDVDAPGDLTGDGSPDALIGAASSDVYLPFAGAAYVVNAPGGDGGDLADAEARILGDRRGGSESLYFGTAVAGVGDLDGDGVADIAVSGPGYYSGSGYPGAVYVFHGPLSGTYVASSADATIFGPIGNMGIGARGGLGSAGDHDGDGHADLLIAVSEASHGSDAYAGAVCVLGGDSITGTIQAVVADGIVYGDAYAELFGASARSAGDVDGDGRDDLLVGSPGASRYGSSSGAAALLYGPHDGSDGVGDVAVATFYGDGAGWSVGWGVGGGADLTGDGILDLVVGAVGHTGEETSSGSMFVLPGGGY